MEQTTKEEVALKITKEMTIGEVIQKYPSAIEPLMSSGVHCVGCGASYFETIEEGLLSHGKSDEEVDEVVRKLNDTIPKDMNQDALIVTEKAALQVKAILAKHQEQKKGLRIAVIPGGCSGMSYHFELENEPKADDTVIEVEGVQFFVDKESMSILNGSKLDYVDTLQGAGFKIFNPNATRTCGCGQSFG